jgi:hypothetical protein
MPYPESCPECGSQFRNTGTHFTARRNEVGRHVLLELGCQNTTRRYWWDFTAGQLADDSKPATVTRAVAAREALVASAAATPASSNGARPTPNGSGPHLANTTSHLGLPSLSVADVAPTEVKPMAPGTFEPATSPEQSEPTPLLSATPSSDTSPAGELPSQPSSPATQSAPELNQSPNLVSQPPQPLKDAFLRQLQLDRLTLRQMRSLLMSEDARRAIEVAVGATEATYERLALILFGADLPQLLGKPVAAPAALVMSAEERLELQREKARIRARLRRAAIKAAKQVDA